jgi:hypothetical protein
MRIASKPLHSVTAGTALLLVTAASTLWAGFAGTDVFLPSVARLSGSASSQWYTKLWIHNPGTSAAFAKVYFLQRDHDNSAAMPYTLTVEAGETQVVDNVVWTWFRVEAAGALRVNATQRLVVSSRIYSQPGEVRDSVGQFFAGVPSSFAIGSGQRTSLLGVFETGSTAVSDFRYNFGFVETSGANATVRVHLRDAAGTELGHQDYPLRPFEAKQVSFSTAFAGRSTENARLDLEVLSGGGRIVAFGSGIANGSQDPSTFEMSFRDDLLAENAGSGLTSVSHDGTLTGDGTASTPLGLADGAVSAAKIAPTAVGAEKLAAGAVTADKLAAGAVSAEKIASGQVVKALNGLRDNVTLAAGANVTLTPSGNTLTIAATGGSGSGAVSSVNGITGAVTIAGTGTASVGTAGSTITVNGTGLSAVSTGTGLSGNGTGGSPLAIANGGVGATQLADGAVTESKLGSASVTDSRLAAGAVSKAKLAATGGTSGQVLGTDGAALVWQTPTGGLSLPYDATITANTSAGFFLRNAGSGPGIEGSSAGGVGMVGITAGSTYGVQGQNAGSGTSGSLGGTLYGVSGLSFVSGGVGVYGNASAGAAVIGENGYQGTLGILGGTGAGVWATSSGVGKPGLFARSVDRSTPAVIAQSGGDASEAVWATNESSTATAALARSNGNAVEGSTNTAGASGVLGQNVTSSGYGVHGEAISASAFAVFGENTGNHNQGHLGGLHGVAGSTGMASRSGVYGETTAAGGIGVYGVDLASGAHGALGVNGLAGEFVGDVHVTGTLTKGGGSFRIDHPLDPANKTLSHSFVESPDMMNVYNGNVVLDENGEAVVSLPEWFEALNRDFRYQLTAIGGPGPNLFIAEKVSGSRFRIAGGTAGLEVSWQVTGIRHDPWANAHRIPVEEDKPETTRGRYVHPELYQQSR